MQEDGGTKVVVNSPRDIFEDLGSKNDEMWKAVETSVRLVCVLQAVQPQNARFRRCSE